MGRLIAFGCSNTYGHGQEDCIDPNDGGPGPEPSKLVWPNYLAEHLQKTEIVNLGLAGASNDHILHRIYHYDDYRKDDLVVVLWTYLDRAGHILNKNEVVDMAAWRNDYLSKNFYKFFHNDYTSKVNLFKNWKLAKSFFLQMRLKHRMFLVTDDAISYGQIPILRPPTNFGKFVELYPKAADGLHAGPEAHKAFADSIFDLILYQRGEER